MTTLVWANSARAQTPTPIADWQLSAGEALIPYFLDEIPEWRFVAAGGLTVLPRYEGASAYKPLP